MGGARACRFPLELDQEDLRLSRMAETQSPATLFGQRGFSLLEGWPGCAP
jgi:hypothetical protein